VLATAQSTQVLLATHSPVILECKDYIKPSHLLCFRLEDGAALIETASDLMWRQEIGGSGEIDLEAPLLAAFCGKGPHEHAREISAFGWWFISGKFKTDRAIT
jgi:hypothetical protein